MGDYGGEYSSEASDDTALGALLHFVERETSQQEVGKIRGLEPNWDEHPLWQEYSGIVDQDVKPRMASFERLGESMNRLQQCQVGQDDVDCASSLWLDCRPDRIGIRRIARSKDDRETFGYKFDCGGPANTLGAPQSRRRELPDREPGFRKAH